MRNFTAIVLATFIATPAIAQEELNSQDNQFIENLDQSLSGAEQAVEQDVQSVNPNVTVTGPTHIESVTKQDGKIIIEYGGDDGSTGN